MATIRLTGFAGENRAINPRMLADGIGTVSLNQKPGRADLRPWREPLTVAAVPSSRKTIYRMGRDVNDPTRYWLSWTSTVHAVRGFDAGDTTERTYFTGDGAPKVTNNIIAFNSGGWVNGDALPKSSRPLGLPRPADALTITVVPASEPDENQQTVFYVYTYVNDWGWESMPSPVSASSTRAQNETATLSGFATPPSGNYNINRIRVYRTQTGATGSTDFYFLRELSTATDVAATALVAGTSYTIKTIGTTNWTLVGAPSNAVGVEFTASGPGTGTGVATAYNLTVADTTDDNRSLNDLLVTTNWVAPPDTLRNLTSMWDGMMAGIAGNTVRICEPFAHYAWPTAYELVPPDSIPVALGVFGQTLLVLTTARPLLVAGSTPEAMDQQPLPISQSCVSAKSAVSMGGGVAWASDDGLCWYGADGFRVLTAGVMIREDWQALVPSSIVGFQYEGLYFGSYDTGTGRKGFLIDPRNPTGIYFLSTGYETAYFDDYTDSMFVLDGTNVKQWDKGTTFLSCTFRSKVFRSENPVNFACAKVVADAYPVTVKVLASNEAGAMVEKLSRSVSSQSPFRLPSGFRSTDWQIEVICNGPVLGVGLADNMNELSGV